MADSQVIDRQPRFSPLRYLGPPSTSGLCRFPSPGLIHLFYSHHPPMTQMILISVFGSILNDMTAGLVQCSTFTFACCGWTHMQNKPYIQFCVSNQSVAEAVAGIKPWFHRFYRLMSALDLLRWM